MIISKTPYRVDLVGDGTDIGSFCDRERGCIVNATIKKFIYVMVHPSNDNLINLVSNNEIENVSNGGFIKNGRVREALKLVGINEKITIHSIAESPIGTGLGGSSSFTVGLLNALHFYKNNPVSLEKLAEEASEIEIDILKEPIGRQDQYAAALGGFNKMGFNNRIVDVSPLTENDKMINYLEGNMMMFYLGGSREASSILTKQNEEMKSNSAVFDSMREMRNLADYISSEISVGRCMQFGEILRKNWEIKRELIGGINNSIIEKYYNLAINSGAEGAKLSGAGGKGFFLVYAPKEKQKKVRSALADLEEHKFEFEMNGSRIIYND